MLYAFMVFRSEGFLPYTPYRLAHEVITYVSCDGLEARNNALQL